MNSLAQLLSRQLSHSVDAPWCEQKSPHDERQPCGSQPQLRSEWYAMRALPVHTLPSGP
jgi:hypothetical protein